MALTRRVEPRDSGGPAEHSQIAGLKPIGFP